MHLGQVGQPSPDPVTRTAAPVTVMPALAITDNRAHRLIERGVGGQKDFTSSMVGGGVRGPSTGRRPRGGGSSRQGVSHERRYVTYYCEEVEETRCPT
ncbi:hypothetical protein GCM10020219_076690 [Nonomuraea dietziae]